RTPPIPARKDDHLGALLLSPLRQENDGGGFPRAAHEKASHRDHSRRDPSRVSPLQAALPRDRCSPSPRGGPKRREDDLLEKAFGIAGVPKALEPPFPPPLRARS